MIETNKGRGRVDIDCTDEELERLTKAALGLTLKEAENVFARALVLGSELDAADIAVVFEEKRQTIRKSGILEFVAGGARRRRRAGEPQELAEQAQRAWLDRAPLRAAVPQGRAHHRRPGLRQEPHRASASPRVGAAAAAPGRRPRLRRLVGSSEGTCAARCAPPKRSRRAVLWIDEIEKGFAGWADRRRQRHLAARVRHVPDLDAGEDAPVFVVATANNITRLPPEILRKGRFDEIFFVDLPTTGTGADLADANQEAPGRSAPAEADRRRRAARRPGRAPRDTPAPRSSRRSSPPLDAFAERRPLDHRTCCGRSRRRCRCRSPRPSRSALCGSGPTCGPWPPPRPRTATTTTGAPTPAHGPRRRRPVPRRKDGGLLSVEILLIPLALAAAHAVVAVAGG